MKLKGAHIGILALVVILGVIGVAFRQQGGTIWPNEAAAVEEAKVSATAEPAAAAAEPPAADEKCPAFAINAEVGTGLVTFTVTPAPEGMTYNWSVSAGTVTSGMGTPSIIVNVTTAGEVLASLDIIGLDPSCPKGAGYVSGSAQVP